MQIYRLQTARRSSTNDTATQLQMSRMEVLPQLEQNLQSHLNLETATRIMVGTWRDSNLHYDNIPSEAN
jgi:hypothetical protein